MVGRPKLAICRDQQLKFSLTAVEYNTVKARAAAAGTRVVDFGRSCLLDDRNAPLPAAIDLRRDYLVYHELKRVGNNLNQLMRYLHATRAPAPSQLDTLLLEIRTILNRGLRHDRAV